MKATRTAKADDWKREDLPLNRTTIHLERRFSAEEMECIQRGCIPREMEDKWFIYWEKDTLFFHRSWTGHCVYVVRFRVDGEEFLMFEADLNRASEQYKATSDEADAALISYLVDSLLLRRSVDFPMDPSNPSGIAKAWSLVGRVLLGEYPEDDRGPVVISKEAEDDAQPPG